MEQAAAGVPIPELCRKYRVSPATFYRWRTKHDALTRSKLQRLNELERENKRMKAIIADLTLDKTCLPRQTAWSLPASTCRGHSLGRANDEVAAAQCCETGGALTLGGSGTCQLFS